MTSPSPVVILDDKVIPDQPHTFVMDWQANTWAPEPRENTSRCLYLCPAGQASNLKNSCTQFNDLHEFGSEQATQRLKEYEHKAQPYECVVVVKSVWQNGVDDIGHSQFVRLLQHLAKSHCRRLIVLTLAAIRCERAYPRVRHPLDAVYLGLAQGFAKETTRLEVGLYSLAQLDQQHIDAALAARLENPNGATVGIGNGSCWIATLVMTQLEPPPSPYRLGATYLIIGGRSGIGAELAKYLARNFKAFLVLVGRSRPDDSLLLELEALGPRPRHEQCDVAEPQALAQVLSRYPTIDGIFHSALQLADTSFENMTADQLLQSLQPKVHGGYQLLEALRLRTQHPGFVTFFSSIQSYIAYPGQANYTAGCLCTDALADLFESLLSIPTRVINWGYWGSVGIVADDAYRTKMHRLQIGSIEPYQAMPLIEHIIASNWPQVACLRQSKKSLRLRHINPDRQIGTADDTKRLIVSPPPKIKEAQIMGQSIEAIARLLQFKVMPNEALQEEALALDNYARYRWHQVRRANKWTIAPQHEKQWHALNQIPNSESLDQEHFLKRYPKLHSLVALVEQCLTHYPAVISGQMTALKVLFPRGDTSLLKNWYINIPTTQLLNVHLAEAIVCHATSTHNHKLKILEIGAGTGSTTRVILPIIANYVDEYCFSDASEAFMKSVSDEFSSYPFMRYKKIDAAYIPEDVRNFDVIIAANVMHAVTPLGNALQNLAATLKDDGLLLLNETVFKHDVLTIAFGITEGWWPVEDTTVNRIEDSPLLESDSWRHALLNNGFSHVVTHGNESFQLAIGSVGRAIGKPLLPYAHNQDAINERQVIADRLCAIVGSVILLEAADLDRQVPLADYGVDSILAIQILEAVSAEFGPQPADTLERLQTIAALAAHFYLSASTAKLPAPQLTATDNPADSSEGPVDDSVIKTITAIIGDVILLEPEDIDHQAMLTDYGVDSILALSIIEKLSAAFGSQPPDLIEKHPSVIALASQFTLQTQIPLPAPDTLPDTVSQHMVGGQRIAPGAYALSWMTETSGARQLTNVCWHRPMVRLNDAKLEYANGRFSITDQRSGHVLCSGEYDLSPPTASSPTTASLANAQVMDSASIYKHFETLGYNYGPLYRGIAVACVGDSQGLSILMTPLTCEKQLPPALIDAGLQTSILLNYAQGRATQMLPTHLSSMRLYSLPSAGETVMCKATLVTRSETGARFDFSYLRLTGEVLFTLTGMLAVGVTTTQLKTGQSLSGSDRQAYSA